VRRIVSVVLTSNFDDDLCAKRPATTVWLKPELRIFVDHVSVPANLTFRI